MSEANNAVVPESLKRLSASEIEIAWSDGKTLRYSAKRLRDACPCATCREKRRGEETTVATAKPRSLGLPILSVEEARPDTIEHLRPVGNYAYNIAFGDGHDSGIFTLEFLYQLGNE